MTLKARSFRTSEHLRLYSSPLCRTYRTGHEGASKNRARTDCVCLPKCDSVSEEEAQTLPNVKPLVLAEDYPKVTVVFPDARLPKRSRSGRSSVTCSSRTNGEWPSLMPPIAVRGLALSAQSLNLKTSAVKCQNPAKKRTATGPLVTHSRGGGLQSRCAFAPESG